MNVARLLAMCLIVAVSGLAVWLVNACGYMGALAIGTLVNPNGQSLLELLPYALSQQTANWSGFAGALGTTIAVAAVAKMQKRYPVKCSIYQAIKLWAEATIRPLPLLPCWGIINFFVLINQTSVITSLSPRFLLPVSVIGALIGIIMCRPRNSKPTTFTAVTAGLRASFCGGLAPMIALPYFFPGQLSLGPISLFFLGILFVAGTYFVPCMIGGVLATILLNVCHVVDYNIGSEAEKRTNIDQIDAKFDEVEKIDPVQRIDLREDIGGNIDAGEHVGETEKIDLSEKIELPKTDNISIVG